MKKTFLILSIAFFTALSSCQKDEPVNVDFSVNTTDVIVNVTDSVTFNLQGYADIIAFYSGEAGNEYANRQRTDVDGLGLRLTIASRVLYGAQEKNLKLLLSTKFSGIYKASDVQESDWIDITDKFTWSTAASGGIAATTTTSGPVDLTDYIVPGKPIYFGYRYESEAATTAATAGRTWRLPTFKLEAITEDGKANEIANVLTAGWTAVPIVSAVTKPENTSYWTIRASDPYLWFTPNSTLEPHLHWMITAPFMPTAIKPDKSKTIKAFIDKMNSTYKYAFKKAGKYKVTFVGINVNNHGQKEVVHELNVEVKEAVN